MPTKGKGTMKIHNPLKMAKPEPSVTQSWLDFAEKERLNLIPCIYQEKTPAIGTWLPYQKQVSTQAEREQWFIKETHNIAVVCGQVSGNLVVIDFDDLKQFKKLFKSPEGLANETLVIQTGKGIHVYYKLAYTPPNMKIAHFGIDIKGEGGYVLMPPSIHPETKQQYKALGNLTELHIKHFDGDILEWLFEKCVKADRKFNIDELREPNKIEDLVKPQSEGARNDATIKLATWYRLKKKTEQETLRNLTEWNKDNKPPLTDRELETIIHSAYKRPKPYNYKYVENPLETEEFSKEIKQEAEKLSKQTDIIPYILAALDEIVGEEKTKVTVFLLNLVKESIDLSGDSSSGKNTIVDGVLECYPKDSYFKITGASAKVLRFLKKVDTLYFAERAAYKSKPDEESLTEYDIKVAISEGQLRTLMTVKEDNEWGYQEIITEIGNVITTSTEVDITPELKNRIWELTTDAGKTQTENVLDYKLGEISKTTQERKNRSNEKAVLRYFIQQLKKEEPKNFVIPYAQLLKPLFDTSQPRARRDVDKLIKAIKASAILHRKHRPTMKEKEEDTIICTPQDFLNAWTYMEDAITGTFVGETNRFKEIWAKTQELIDAGKTIDADTLARAIGKQPNSMYQWMRRFVSQGLGTMQKYPKSKQYYFTPIEQNDKGTETVEIKVDDLYVRYEQWVKKQLQNCSSNGFLEIDFEKKCNQGKSIFFKKRLVKIIIPNNSEISTGNNYPTPEEKADWFEHKRQEEERN